MGARDQLPILLGNYGDAALRTGDWMPVLGELCAVLTEEWATSDRVYMVCAAGCIQLLRGDAIDDGLASIGEAIGVEHDPQLRAVVENVAAVRLFAAGDLVAAASSWRRVVSHEEAQLPVAQPRAARATLWSGDAAAAMDDLRALEASGLHGPAIDASHRTIRAGLAALEGRVPEALAGYRESLRAWQDLGLAWDAALCGLDMALLLDPTEPQVAAAAQHSREILVRLGAVPFITRLDAALARSASPA